MSETCKERVNRGDSRWSNFAECGRAVKKDGLCGIHLAARDRRAKKDESQREKERRGDQLRREANALSDHLGIAIEANYAYNFGGAMGQYDGRFIVPGEWLREIAGQS